jgi:ParB/RepB/Spo0J family partition protein
MPQIQPLALVWNEQIAFSTTVDSTSHNTPDAAMEGANPAPALAVPTKLAVGLHQVAPHSLVPHRRNARIYGEDEDVSHLVESIRNSGWIKPLVITPARIVISGHRRRMAALALDLETVPVEVREFESATAELEALLLENDSRQKTIEQKVREADAWKEIERELARKRKLATLKLGDCRPDVENFPHRETVGKTRDALATRVGLGSGKTYEKASKVVARIDEEETQGNRAVAKALRFVLNRQSVDAAHQLIKKPVHESALVLELIAKGDAQTTKQAEKLVRQNCYHKSSARASFEGYSVGDWVEVIDPDNPYYRAWGRVELLMLVEGLLSVSLEETNEKKNFSPQELTLIAKAPPPCSFAVGDLVRLDLDRTTSIDVMTRKYNGLWGIVLEIGELGSCIVDVGSTQVQLLPFDLQPIDNPSPQLKDVAHRVLRLRKLSLDEIEEKMLDVLQTREEFSTHQLVHLENIEKLYTRITL